MRIALALSASLLIIGSAPSALAEECETTAYAGAYTGYAFQDLGIVVEDRPVLQAGATRTCGALSYDLWTSTTLSSEGPYGNRGSGDEVDVTVSWSGTVGSPVGTLEIEASGAYWLLADFGRSRDDFVSASLKVGRPVELGAVTMMPYVQVSEWIGLDGAYDTTLVRAGVSASLPLGERWTADFDLSHVDEFRDQTSTWRADLELTRTFRNGWSFAGSVKAAERMGTVFGLGAAKAF